MPRARDLTKVSTNLPLDAHEKFEAWLAQRGLSTAEALRQAVLGLLQQQKPAAVAQVRAKAAEAAKADGPRVRVVPKPVDDRERARSPSAVPLANADAIAGQESFVADSRASEEMELEEFLRSPVTRALLSAWKCSRCGTPVDRKWTHCPVCGNDEMRARDIGDYGGFDEALDRWRNAGDIAED